MLCIKFPFKP